MYTYPFGIYVACHYLFVAECALECFYSICWFTILFCKHRFQVYIVVFKQNTTALFSKYHPNSINFISRFLGGGSSFFVHSFHDACGLEPGSQDSFCDKGRPPSLVNISEVFLLTVNFLTQQVAGNQTNRFLLSGFGHSQSLLLPIFHWR